MVAGFLILAGCGGPSQTVAASKYDQTWPADYNVTTCADWSGKMTEHQRFVAAGDQVFGARKSWDVQALPSDALISKFESAMTVACASEPTLTIVDASFAVAFTAGKAVYGG